jgi:hypothetical protein
MDDLENFTSYASESPDKQGSITVRNAFGIMPAGGAGQVPRREMPMLDLDQPVSLRDEQEHAVDEPAKLQDAVLAVYTPRGITPIKGKVQRKTKNAWGDADSVSDVSSGRGGGFGSFMRQSRSSVVQFSVVGDTPRMSLQSPQRPSNAAQPQKSSLLSRSKYEKVAPLSFDDLGSDGEENSTKLQSKRMNRVFREGKLHFCWQQDADHVDLLVPYDGCTANEVEVRLGKSALQIHRGNAENYIDAKLFGGIQILESYLSYAGSAFTIKIKKLDSGLWPSVFRDAGGAVDDTNNWAYDDFEMDKRLGVLPAIIGDSKSDDGDQGGLPAVVGESKSDDVDQDADENLIYQVT